MADNNRIPVIINEIKYWKSHKLLPPEQCDFLLALYTNGDSVTGKQETAISKGYRIRFHLIVQLCLLIFLLPFSFLVLYFTEFHPGLQLGILILFLCYAFWSYSYNKQTKIWLMQLSIIIALFLLLLLTVFLGNQLTDYPSILQIIIPLNFIGWFIVGRKLRIRHLIITSIFLLVFSIIYFTL